VDQAQTRREAWWQFAAMVNRAIGDAALMFAAGGVLFAVLVLHGRIPERLPLRRAVAGAATLAIASMAAGVAITGGWLLGSEPGALFAAGIWQAGLGTNTASRSAVGAVALALAVLAFAVTPSRAACAIAVVAALMAAGSLALSGHVAGLDPAWPGQLALALHAAAVAFWLGSLWPLHAIVRIQPAAVAARVLRRFSAIAVPAVAMLALAGTGVALTRLRSLDALIGTSYGRLLVFKLAFVAMMIAIAIRNRRTLAPALDAALPGAGGRLARNIRVEIGFAGAVLLLTAILGHTPPGQDADAGHTHTAHSGLSVTAESRGHTLRLEVTPAHRGDNQVAVVVTAPSGAPLAAKEAEIALSMPELGIEPLTRPLRRLGDGTFVLDRLDLPVSGRWQIRIDILISDFEKLTFATELAIH
jgi:copper transport protein